MSISIITRQSYSEIDEFLNLLDEETRNEIPKKLREIFKNEKDNQYHKEINPNIPIEEQNLKEETLAIIALLNLKYWCKDEKEKKRLEEIYANNDKKFQGKINTENIFNNRNIKKEENIILYKESIFTKIKNKIKNYIIKGS